MSMLDKSREYGRIMPPEIVNGQAAIYEQDDCWYDNGGKRVLRAGESDADKPKMRTKPEKPSWRRGVQTPKKVVNKRRQFPREAPAPAPDADAFADGRAAPTINLAEWGTGKKRYLWGVVRKEIRSRFNVDVTNETDALELLMKESVIPRALIPSEEAAA